MARHSRDLLSLLLQRESPREPAPTTRENDARPAPASPPSPFGPRETEVRPTTPRPLVRPRASAPKGDAAPAAGRTPELSSPRVYVPSGHKDPMTLTQIAATPAPSQPRTHARTTSELALMRLVLYPILFLILIFALWFAWGRVFGTAAAGSGQNSDKSGKLNDPTSDNSKTGGPAGEHPERGIGNNNNAAGANINSGNGGNNSNNNNSDINNPAAGENGASSAQNSPAGGERIQVLRIAAYPDSPDGLEIANATVSKLRELGFTDARAVRVAKDKEGKRFEIVLLAGRGDSARDPDLIRLGERIRALPPFTPGQSKKHPFDDALIVRQPEADATAGAR